MGTPEKRIDKIAKSLTPKQALIVWMEEAHKFESLDKYAIQVIERPEDFPHLGDIVEQVELAVLDRTQGEPEEKVRKAIRNAVREASFLYFLHLQVTQHLCSVAQAMSQRSLLLSERVCTPFSDLIPVNRMPMETATGAMIFVPMPLKYLHSRQQLDSSRSDILTTTKFSGGPLPNNLRTHRSHHLIKNRREDSFYLSYWRRSRGKKQQHPGDYEKERPNFNFDLDVLKESIDQKNACKLLVDLAYAETLQFMEEKKGALKFIESCMRTMT